MNRTDLAVELNEGLQKASNRHKMGIAKVEKQNDKTPGIEVEKEHLQKEDIYLTTIRVTSKEGERALGKPMGEYITIEVPRLQKEIYYMGEEGREKVSDCLCAQLEKLVKGKQIDMQTKAKKILIVGLGNRKITSDSLGPKVVDQLMATGHLHKIMPENELPFGMCDVFTIAPGVMAQTGMETVAIVKGIVAELAPDLICVIDALKAWETKRLGTTIQIADTGIAPGSGVGNHRNAFDEASLGVPVLALGVPTVIEAKSMLEEKLGEALYVTPGNIDELMERLVQVIAGGMNRYLLNA
ncbi:MAG: GPR endopeptidase [Lachnospiraceae bacterium]|nr:GPR endopeptidase [Lachnospiraceae bacterium]